MSYDLPPDFTNAQRIAESVATSAAGEEYPAIAQMVVEDTSTLVNLALCYLALVGAEGEGTFVITELSGCARCGEDHGRLIAMPLTQHHGRCSHWARCPDTGEPIMVARQPYSAGARRYVVTGRAEGATEMVVSGDTVTAAADFFRETEPDLRLDHIMELGEDGEQPRWNDEVAGRCETCSRVVCVNDIHAEDADGVLICDHCFPRLATRLAEALSGKMRPEHSEKSVLDITAPIVAAAVAGVAARAGAARSVVSTTRTPEDQATGRRTIEIVATTAAGEEPRTLVLFLLEDGFVKQHGYTDEQLKDSDATGAYL